MPLYENVFIIRQDLSAAATDLASQYAQTIEEQGGKIVKRESWGLLPLAYRIRKNRKGHFFLFNIDAPSQAIQELERQMRLNSDTLRYLTIRIDDVESGPSAMLRQVEHSQSDRPSTGRSFNRSSSKPIPSSPSDDARPQKSDASVSNPQKPMNDQENSHDKESS